MSDFKTYEMGIPPTFEMRIRNILDEIYDTLVRKNHDYGNAYERDGILSIVDPEEKLLVRIDDKIMRIAHLNNIDGIQCVNESKLDSYKDLAGYIVLMIDRKTQNVPKG